MHLNICIYIILKLKTLFFHYLTKIFIQSFDILELNIQIIQIFVLIYHKMIF